MDPVKTKLYTAQKSFTTLLKTDLAYVSKNSTFQYMKQVDVLALSVKALFHSSLRAISSNHNTNTVYLMNNRCCNYT